MGYRNYSHIRIYAYTHVADVRLMLAASSSESEEHSAKWAASSEKQRAMRGAISLGERELKGLRGRFSRQEGGKIENLHPG